MIQNHYTDSKRRAADFPSVMKFDSHDSTDNKVTCNVFAEFFASI